jgi:hypothetical protein
MTFPQLVVVCKTPSYVVPWSHCMLERTFLGFIKYGTMDCIPGFPNANAMQFFWPIAHNLSQPKYQTSSA